MPDMSTSEINAFAAHVVEGAKKIPPEAIVREETRLDQGPRFGPKFPGLEKENPFFSYDTGNGRRAFDVGGQAYAPLFNSEGKIVGQVERQIIGVRKENGKAIEVTLGGKDREGRELTKMVLPISEFAVWQARNIGELQKILADTPILEGSHSDDPRKTGRDWIETVAGAFIDPSRMDEVTTKFNLRQKVRFLKASEKPQ